ncbi:MAG TPA: carboxypeptidase-like regulatory domain-containing protein, partial [Candidatus Eremiobacteraceae bacterium]|nr:carboxypeptidase-like regulatory domain-containing protein [Candidatus Eremiobacteraceae bacterium]
MPSSQSIYRSVIVSVVVALFAVAAVVHAQPALAGTTGTLSGYVVVVGDKPGAPDIPVAGAKVTATSPTDSESATTDAQGYFAFVDLPPDTYTVSASRDGYVPIVQAGVTVVADNAITVRLVTEPAIKVIARDFVSARPGLLAPSTV